MARFMIAVLLSFLLCPILGVIAQVSSSTPTGVGSFDPLDGTQPTPVLHLTVTPTAVTPCQNLTITWTIDNDNTDFDISQISLQYTNFNVSQSTYDPQGTTGTIVVWPISRLRRDWRVFLTDPGNYIINGTIVGDTPGVVVQSSPWELLPGDASCLAAPSSSGITDTPLSSDAPSQSQTSTPISAASHSNTGAIAGGVVAGIVVIACIAAFLLLRRRRNKRVANLGVLNNNQRLGGGKGHQRKWGGLSSIDKLQQGEIPVVIPSNSPYTSPTYRNRSGSTGHAMTDEEGLEKGYGKETFPVDADLLSEMPTLDSNRNSRRYSSDALSNVLRQTGGLAVYSEEHHTANVAAPVLTTTHATFNGGDDPFTDTSFTSRGKRSSALSVPSTARAPSRLSDTSTRPTPSPIPPPTTSAPPSQNNTMVRNTSATASLGRPARKPVPQYTDDSFELTNTSKSSPSTHSHSQSHSAWSPITKKGNSSSDTSPVTPLRNSPNDSSAYWLQDRAPVANRNIGLAGQSEGPVHYLMPDLPPPAQ